MLSSARICAGFYQKLTMIARETRELCGLKAVIVWNLGKTYPDQPSIIEVSLLLGSVGLLSVTLPEWIQSQLSALPLCFGLKILG